MQITKASGRLMLIGGGEDREKDRLILERFVDLAGGKEARIVVLTTATNVPEKYVDVYTKAFNGLKVKTLKFVDISQREDAMKQANIELAKSATGIFFTGGKQLYITSLMGGTQLQSAIFYVYETGVIICGTSAGAAVMGSSMIIRGESKLSPRIGSVEIMSGSGLITGCVIDTHFSQRGRHGRLITAVAHFPQHVGFGIDENTAMIVDKNIVEVIGEGSVTVVDASEMTHSDFPYLERGQSIALAHVVLNVLPNGSRYDLKSRKMIVPQFASGVPEHALKKARDARVSEKAKTE